jgi:putative ABC transport system permease protein
MRAGLALVRASIRNAPGRAALRILILAVAASLVGAMLVFVSGSLRTMTRAAVATVPVDLQAPVPSATAATDVARTLGGQQDVLGAVQAATAPFAAAGHQAPVGAIRTGRGAILAVGPSYTRVFPTVRLLHGSLRPGSIVLDQQLAATLQARVGDTVSLLPRPGAPPVRFPVSGVALVQSPDVLFQPLEPLLGPAPAQPPANVAVMPMSTFAHRFAPLLPRASQGQGPSTVPGAATGTQWQVAVQLDPSALHGDPSQASATASAIRGRLERTAPGVRFVDNLSDALTTAAGDALYAETLFIMLAVPGALVALGVVYLAALGTADRDRRDAALLLARGARRRDLAVLALVEGLVLGVVGGALGAAASFAAVSRLVRGGVQVGSTRAVVVVLVCILVAVAGATAARLAVSLTAGSGPLVEGRRSVRRTSRPLWQRLWLDVGCLAASGLVYWLTARTGFSAVVNPDSNPTLSLSVYMFLAPLLLWVGAALLLVRLRGRIVALLAGRAAGRRPTTSAGLVLASASRRGTAINRGLVLVGLLLAFGVELGLFAATYDQQSAVDARLTLGADAVVTAPPGVIAGHGLDSRIAAVPGVSATSAVDHSYAYVGPDLQDTFGIDASTLPRATTLRDSYFLGGTARATLDRLRSTPDGILVSKETITDYQLREGDLLQLRVLDRRTGRFRLARFHVAGVVQEFPAAPRDSFMVANGAYLTSLTHDGGPNVVFVKTSQDPVAVARRVAAATRADGTIVANIRDQARVTGSSITAVDLTGISRIEEVFAVLLAACAVALLVALAVAERRHELATMAALGARRRTIGAYLWSEGAIVLVGALLLAAGLGLLLAEMLVAMLRHVFDPPPDQLAVPWAYLGALVAAAVGTALLAGAVSMRRVRRLRFGAILREQ